MKYKWYAVKIAIICVVVWILQQFIPSLTDDFALVSSEVFSKPWTLITYIFLHGGFDHLFFNMFALVLFGSLLERVIGERKFLITFIVSGIIAGIGSVIFYSSSIGASGAIYGIIGTLVILRPTAPVFVGFMVPLPMIVAVIVWTAGDLIGIFTPSGNIAYAAHLFGLAFGLTCGIYLMKNYGEHPFRKKSEISEEEFEKWEDRYVKLSDSDF
jgi:membrane associated rhomboid family serine protease